MHFVVIIHTLIARQVLININNQEDGIHSKEEAKICTYFYGNFCKKNTNIKMREKTI